VSDLIERWSKYQHGDVIADRFIVQDTIDEIERLEGIVALARALVADETMPEDAGRISPEWMALDEELDKEQT